MESILSHLHVVFVCYRHLHRCILQFLSLVLVPARGECAGTPLRLLAEHADIILPILPLSSLLFACYHIISLGANRCKLLSPLDLPDFLAIQLDLVGLHALLNGTEPLSEVVDRIRIILRQISLFG